MYQLLITQTVFFSITIIGCLYFSLAKRQFDALALAFAASSVYFLPGYFGYTLEKNDQQDISIECYGVMILLLASLLVMAIFTDNYTRRSKTPIDSRAVTFRYPSFLIFLPISLTIVEILGLSYSVYSSGSSLLSTSKIEMYSTFNRGHLIWLMGAPTALVISFGMKKWPLVAINALSVLFALFIGTRIQLAVGVVGCLYLFLNQRGSVPLLKSKKIFITIMMFCAFIFLYKKVYIAIKMGDAEYAKERLSDGWVTAFTESEPFLTQHILNVVILEDYRLPFIESFSRAVLTNFNLSEGSSRDASFGDLATHDIFGDVGYGMASNIWAEYYSYGGLYGVSLFILLYVLLLGLYQSANSSKIHISVIASWLPWIAFYIHRNDTYRMVSFFKQFVVIIIMGIIVSYFVSFLAALYCVNSTSGHGSYSIHRRFR